MPLYEYRCHQCEKIFEVLQKIGERRAQCPDCRSEDTEKVVSRFSSNVESKNACSIGSGST
ncbi:MAG: zinc ribbon domain-containing protein [bacterium]|nr:zinc ribbon domain-containing protein [bacterium]